MVKNDLVCVKGDPATRQGIGTTIFYIAHDRVSDEGKLCAYLVKPAGGESYFDQRFFFNRFYHFISEFSAFGAGTFMRKNGGLKRFLLTQVVDECGFFGSRPTCFPPILSFLDFPFKPWRSSSARFA